MMKSLNADALLADKIEMINWCNMLYNAYSVSCKCESWLQSP